MRFLVDASLPRAAGLLLRRHGHTADDVRDIGLGTADDSLIAADARERKLALLTADFDFADIRAYPPQEYNGIVVIERPEHATIPAVLTIIQRLLDATDLHDYLPGRLAIVSLTRIRLRPALPEGHTPR